MKKVLLWIGKTIKKHITFKFKDEKKKSIRLANLEKTFQDETFKKEYLEQQFLINQKTEEIGNFKIKVNTEAEKTNEEKLSRASK